MRRVRPSRRWAPVLVLPALVGVVALGPLASSGGADTSLVGYNASALAIGAQFAFNIPGVVPLPNENLMEDDVPFARVKLGAGPVIDSIGAPYYPGDIAASLGTLLSTFGAPALPLNDPLLAESKYPTSPGYPASVTFPQGTQPGQVPVAQSTATTSTGGGSASGTLTDLSLTNLLTAGKVPVIGGVLSSSSGSPVDVGNISATNKVVVGGSSITSTATSTLGAIDIAGLVDIAELTSTAVASSDGTTGTPKATEHLGNVTVDGTAAYIDSTGVHIAQNASPPVGITLAQLQQTVNATLGQDGITVRLLDPKQTSSGAQASADSGGLAVSLTHQFAVPFVPGEPTLPIPELGNVGLPAGDYTMTTSVTFGLAQASVNASVPSPTTGTTGNTGTAASAANSSTLGTASATTGVTGNTGFGSLGEQGLAQSIGAPTGGTGSGAPTPVSTSATAFPIKGIPAPLGWAVTAVLACVLLAYPLLVLARWQFAAAGRRRP